MPANQAVPTPIVYATPLPPKGKSAVLEIPAAGLGGPLRRATIVLAASAYTERETSDVWWYLSATAVLEAPLPHLNITEVNIAPSLLPVAPLGGPVMPVAVVYWPPSPPISAFNIKFSTAFDQAQGRAYAWGFPDTTPHDFCGLFRCPFGFRTHPARRVDPIPVPPVPRELRGAAHPRKAR